MIDLISVLVLGFFLGMRHATDPDHVVAVSTIVSRQHKLSAAAWIGVLWGLGHTLTICVVGSAIIFAGWAIPVRMGLSMEFSVALMLIVLGIANLVGFLRNVPSLHALSDASSHRHFGHAHFHPHAGPPEVFSESDLLPSFRGLTSRFGLYQVIRPLAVGIVHGLAGSAAVALLVLATIKDPRWAFLYLFVFGAGTIAGMFIITVAISLPFSFTRREFSGVHRALRMTTGLISLGFGCFLTYQIGFVSGLFTSHPLWTPR